MQILSCTSNLHDMIDYIPRKIESKIVEIKTFYPVLIVTGPRQSGKTTLCRHLFPDFKYVNLESISERRKAIDDPQTFLENLGNEVIIDEVQYVPELLSQIQVHVDEDKTLRYILTGSCNFSLLQTVTQSLAGRAALFTLLPLSLKEISPELKSESFETIAFKGSYPGVIAGNIPVETFYNNYYNTYIERDVRDLIHIKNLDKFDMFVRLLAGRTSSEFNASSLAVEAGVSSNTISEWLTILKASYILFSLPPYYTNINKRLTKSAKIYFYDTGLMLSLLEVEEPRQIVTHPLRGAVFENLVVSEVIKARYNLAKRPNYYFYRENSGREVDLLQETPEGIILSEIKSGKTYNTDFRKNLDYLSKLISNVTNARVIYDGESMPPKLLNFRDV